MDVWTGITVEDIDVDALAEQVRAEGKPVHENVLARVVATQRLQDLLTVRLYAPGARYRAGERIVYDNQEVTVKTVREGGNPKQGDFQVLTLVLPNGTERYMAAGIVDASTQDQREVTKDEVDCTVKEHGVEIRAALWDALNADERFVWFQNAQGSHWCLAEMLPPVGPEELGKIADALPEGLDEGEPVSKTTEDLVKAVWGEGDDGSNTYALRAAALTKTCMEFRDLEWMVDHWVSKEAWTAFAERELIRVPRMPTNIEPPVGLAHDEESESMIRTEMEQESGDEIVQEGEDEKEDLESWRKNHPTHAKFTLNARSYYEGWLPLTKSVVRLFPPFDTDGLELVFYFQFAGTPGFFKTWLDWDQQRLWIRKDMYEALREFGVYPGARLSISARNEREYDLATRTATKTDPVRVWRMWLNEDGKIDYSDDLEPRRYDVDDDVFVADVRFEDRLALFQQAEEAGNSIFGLMYERSVERWEAGTRNDLFVTVDELFEAVHFDEDGRMTCKATVAWELWRRLAFESVGGGKYRFRPEYGDRMRALWSEKPKRRPKKAQQKRRVQRTGSLATVFPEWEDPTSVSDVWEAIDADVEKKAKLETAIQAYKNDPSTDMVLFLRRIAHQKMRSLLAEDRLDVLTLDQFNQNVWQFGSVRYQGESAPWKDLLGFLGTVNLGELETAHQSGELEIEGNQTWGSSSHVVGPMLGKLASEMESVVRDAVRELLYGKGGDEQRMKYVIEQPNGFGMNVVSGIMHVMNPKDHILYNRRSVDALRILGADWPNSWQYQVGKYVRYLKFCQHLKRFGEFQSLTDVDWFMYSLSIKAIPHCEESGAREEALAFLLGLILGKGEINRSSRLVRIELRYGPYGGGSHKIRGGGLVFDEREVLPNSMRKLHAQLKESLRRYDSSVHVSLDEGDPYRHPITVGFGSQSNLFSLITSWYPTGSSYRDFRFPATQLDSASADFALAFMRGYTCAQGLITDTTRLGTSGPHRVYIRASSANKELLNDIKGLLEHKLGIPIAGIHWHEGRDPQLRVYAEKFVGVGFGLDWEDKILAACAQENLA